MKWMRILTKNWRQCTWVLKAKHERGFKGTVRTEGSLSKDKDRIPETHAMVDSTSNPDLTDQGEMEEMTEIAIDRIHKTSERELLFKIFQDVSDAVVEHATKLKQIAKTSKTASGEVRSKVST